MTGGDEDRVDGLTGGEGREAGERPAAREPKALRVQREDLEDLVVPLYPDRAYIFGRAPESTVVFAHESVSRQHGRLSLREDHRWVYRDLDSKNGSHVGRPEGADGASRVRFHRLRASVEHVLEVGDVVLLGNGKGRITLLTELPEEGRPSAFSPRLSPTTVQFERAIDRCARHSLPVFLRGDSGTGKTFIAREIHRRAGLEGAFIVLNCGRLPQDPASLTSELLGHTKGAYTGASLARVGKLHAANGGTLFLDEVEFLPRIAQDFLVDVLEGSGSLAPLGAPADYSEPPPRFRLISASKVPLRQTSLRPDLAQRLAAGDFIILPTLEERREDIPHLVATFLHRLKVEQQYDAQLTPEALDFLSRARWPGQIRELESTVRTVVAREAAQQTLDGGRQAQSLITLEAVRSYLEQRALGFDGEPAPVRPPREAEPPVGRKRPGDLTVADIQDALARHGGNKTRTAAELGIALNTLKTRMKALGLG